MKLKTIKDLPFVKKAIGGKNIYKEIKAEAIKWVKSDIYTDDWRTIFKKFCDLTEEDLE